MPSTCCRNPEALEKWPGVGQGGRQRAGGKPRYTMFTLKGCIWTGSKKSAEYKKLLLGNDSGALDDLAESALKSESDSSGCLVLHLA